ncbi:LytTR family DNA-binding domain-containing protein [Flagellimonas sp. CMM7]|uniref:LytR/AlgR family response regulator transcription factor n=1 Tax=Flagellimonas sp. CMM7 TaxID=2654676 RepID=UPI0013D40CAA|nr:LytTR family DNA-binding domain-containing protein [Flagellimonas sp. CMM7]UII78338.1 LytTR family DNA-binding domain-containing protein [Flagellimonas sp. CMM7]
MNIVIIDDTTADIEYCKELLAKNFDNSNILECFADSVAGLEYVNKHKPDLLILDMEMPQLGGLDLIKQLKSARTEIVFYTSHAGFALEAYRNFALGFLLKPINEPEFVGIITKALHRLEQEKKGNLGLDNLKSALQALENKKVPIPTMGCTYFPKVMDIVRLESVDSYAKIHLADGNIHLSSYGIKHFEQSLTPPLFFRVHKSHLVNLKRVEKLFPDGTLVMNNGDHIPVARRRRAELLELF